MLVQQCTRTVDGVSNFVPPTEASTDSAFGVQRYVVEMLIEKRAEIDATDKTVLVLVPAYALAMPCPEFPVVLRFCYEMSDIGIAYAATHRCYGYATGCPVLTWDMLLPGARSGHYDVVEKLLALKANPNLQTKFLLSAYEIFCADAAYGGTQNRWTCLMFASDKGHAGTTPTVWSYALAMISPVPSYYMVLRIRYGNIVLVLHRPTHSLQYARYQPTVDALAMT
eukprot:3316765-Rhodomonas_salina.2